MIAVESIPSGNDNFFEVLKFVGVATLQTSSTFAREFPKSLHEILEQMITGNFHGRFLEASRNLLGRRKVQYSIKRPRELAVKM